MNLISRMAIFLDFTAFLIQVISSGKFCFAEEIDLSFISITKEHPLVTFAKNVKENPAIS